jgi:CubicO group peptidase (beta-lactamase class C family)
MNRRDAISLPLLLASSGTFARVLDNNGPSDGSVHIQALDTFIEGYLEAMNGPGLALCTANRQGALQVSAFGYADLPARVPLTTAHLAEIGSLSKSFLALAILQLNEAGKVDLHAPIRRYLPWLEMETSHGEILVHHLLTHSSGMPANAPVFPISASMQPRQAFAPGAKFHYCNWGFEVLGHVITHLEGLPWPEVLRDRILRPLGMRDSSAIVAGDVLSRVAQSYVPLYNDRPYPRHGPIVPAQTLTITTAAGAIAAPPADMARYLQMILNHGAMPSGRLVSEASFDLFVTPHIAAPMFGPSASYGYGIAIDLLDGRRRLKHTGGTASVMSAMQIDIDGGLAAFASINAQLGYRPEPVVEYALRLLHSRETQQPDPGPPPFDADARISTPEAFIGSFRSLRGSELKVRKSRTGGLELEAYGRTGALQPTGSDSFVALHPDFALYPILFGRHASVHTEPASSTNAIAVTEMAYGPDIYISTIVESAADLSSSRELEPYVGVYSTENPWYDSARIVQRQGKLWLSGDTVLIPTNEHRFRIGDDPSTPEHVEFSCIVEGQAQVLVLGNAVLRRLPVNS